MIRFASPAVSAMAAIIVTLPLALLSSCTTVMPTARQPVDGPRARVRLASFADELTVEVVQPDGKKGTLYTRSGFYPGKSDLDMPKGSSGWPGHNEYYVVGNQMVLAHSEITRVPSGVSVVASHCEVSGRIWLDSGKDYEIGVVTGQGQKGWDMTSCFITATELIASPNGETTMKPVPVLPVLAPPRRG
ncbi:hypothetical protein DyAD56_15085 [Dyella sp. AD56]|uniref:hypothetical protein n=1 Tax=Dyella sp. AD56 TaxID=1528744 RepID=UPI000CC1AD1A|nr:hypothetical protein [Dyella sp. AD56]PMQ04323.1 hypothetical protein DyAD56_15085 [Dyella sp. AD56]